MITTGLEEEEHVPGEEDAILRKAGGHGHPEFPDDAQEAALSAQESSPGRDNEPPVQAWPMLNPPAGTERLPCAFETRVSLGAPFVGAFFHSHLPECLHSRQIHILSYGRSFPQS